MKCTFKTHTKVKYTILSNTHNILVPLFTKQLSIYYRSYKT